MNYITAHATTVQDRKSSPSSIYEVPHIQQTTPPDTPYSIESRTSTLIYEHHLDAKSLYMNIQKPAHHGAQGELMHSTQDFQKISINVTACTSWTPRSIKFAKASHFFQSSATFLKPIHETILHKKLRNSLLKSSNSTKERQENHPNISKH